ncbi:MAG TPA: PhzF family phenazine biosynthesis protein [Gemmatimonadales bacterium]|nr:PhzF family phenazine biosynthesis protein [Gemmatimonadales bacterium]
MTIPLFLIDAFAGEAFSGNPAAVTLLPDPRPDSWMQALAREMNQAETAFLLRREAGFGLRWFTPAIEVDLCGHATLASAHFLWEEGHLGEGDSAVFHTRSGILTATRDGDWITLDFPATPAQPKAAPPGLLEALGAGTERADVLRSRFDYLVVLEDPARLQSLSPDLGRLRTIEARGVIVTAPSDRADADFISRFFAPRSGVDEDPVTGSAHCALAPYWSARLGRRALTGYQASARGGFVRVEDLGDRVRLAGKAVTVVRGSLENRTGQLQRSTVNRERSAGTGPMAP